MERLFYVCYFSTAVLSEQPVSYKNYQVWKVDFLGRNVTSEFLEKIKGQDVWHEDQSGIDFLLNATETVLWNKYLGTYNMSYRVLLKDVQEKIDKEILMKNRGSRRKGIISWTSYPNLKEINAFLEDVAASNKTNCILSAIGKTAHMKDIKMLKLSNNKPSNPAILIVGGIHAREWTAVISVLYFIDRVARNFSSQPEHISDNDWYIIPVLNPDGYEYSMAKDRLWRKNRRLFSGPCDGVDINRNFDYSWCTRGGSYSICKPNFCGIHAFSEAESIAVRNVISQRHFLAFISVRSYGRMVLFPWALKTNPTPDIKDHIRVSRKVAEAMHAVDRKNFRTRSVARSGLESGSGMAVDWAYSQGVVHSYVIETRGERYFLEPSHVLMAAKEVYAGLNQFAIMM